VRDQCIAYECVVSAAQIVGAVVAEALSQCGGVDDVGEQHGDGSRTLSPTRFHALIVGAGVTCPR
jgi:hypothetical protein